MSAKSDSRQGVEATRRKEQPRIQDPGPLLALSVLTRIKDISATTTTTTWRENSMENCRATQLEKMTKFIKRKEKKKQKKNIYQGKGRKIEEGKQTRERRRGGRGRDVNKCNQCKEKIAKIMIDVDCLIGLPDAPREKRSKWRRPFKYRKWQSVRVLTLSNAISSLIYVNHSKSWVVSDDISNIREVRVPYDPMIIK